MVRFFRLLTAPGGRAGTFRYSITLIILQRMKIYGRFPFLFCQLSLLFGLLSLVVKSPGDLFCRELMLAAAAFGVVYWLMVVRIIHKEVYSQHYKKAVWLLLTLLTPLVGALMYQLLHEARTKVADPS